jgi:hypothetical protein
MQYTKQINFYKNSPYLNQKSPMQIGKKVKQQKVPIPPKPNRFPHALRLDDLDHRRFIFIVDRVESRSAKETLIGRWIYMGIDQRTIERMDHKIDRKIRWSKNNRH